MTQMMFHKAIEALQKGGMSQQQAEKLLIGVITEMIDATDDAVYAPSTVTLTEHEHNLASEITAGLMRGGMMESHAILLLAMYSAALETRIIQC